MGIPSQLDTKTAAALAQGLWYVCIDIAPDADPVILIPCLGPGVMMVTALDLLNVEQVLRSALQTVQEKIGAANPEQQSGEGED